MTAKVEGGVGRAGSHVRIAAWCAAGGLLLVPLVAMRFTSEVKWTLGDFVFAGLLIGSAGAGLEFLARRNGTPAFRAGAALMVLGVFLLVWINGAVGVIGRENEAANGLYGALIGLCGVSAVWGGFRPWGMARAAVLMAAGQVAIAAAALIFRLGADGPIWPRDVLGVTAIFVALWLTAALLFRKAAGGAR